MHALFGMGWTLHLGIPGSCHKDISTILDLLLEVLFFRLQLIKDSSAEGTC